MCRLRSISVGWTSSRGFSGSYRTGRASTGVTGRSDWSGPVSEAEPRTEGQEERNGPPET